MTPAETLTLAAYFFVVIVLAIYGWHRYYLVYLYMSNRDKEPVDWPAARSAAGRHHPAAALQRDVRRRAPDRRGLRASTTRAICSRSRCWTTRPTRRAASPSSRCGATPRRASTSSTSTATTAPATRRARSRPGSRSRAASSSRIFDADFIPTADFLTRLMPHFRDPKVGMVQARWGHINHDYSLLTKIQAILLDGHFILEHGGRNRGGRFFNFNGTAGVWRRTAIDRRRRLAARHAHRGSRSQLPRAAARLAVRVRAGPDRAGRSAGRDERLQVAAAPLGQGLDPDLPQAAAAHPEVGPAARRQGRGVLPPHGELQLHPDVHPVHPDVPVDGDPLQHGLVRDDPHRRAAVLRRDVLVLQLLHGLPARAAQGLDRRG